MTPIINPGLFFIDLPQRSDTWENVMRYFDGKPAHTQTSAEAWSWYRDLCNQDYQQDCTTFEREAAKIALTWVITQSALLRMKAAEELHFQLVNYIVPKGQSADWPKRTLRSFR